MTIAELAPGQSGVIAAYRGADAEERHLLDMGLTPGVRVRLIGTAAHKASTASRSACSSGGVTCVGASFKRAVCCTRRSSR